MSIVKPWWKIPSNVSTVKDCAYTGALIMRRMSGHCSHLTLTLKPSLYPRDLFEHVAKTQTAFNYVVDALSQDYIFMQKSLERYDRTINLNSSCQLPERQYL